MDNPAWLLQREQIHLWCLIAKRHDVPKDIRLMIAQEYLWNDEIPRNVEIRRQMIMVPYEATDDSIAFGVQFLKRFLTAVLFCWIITTLMN